MLQWTIVAATVVVAGLLLWLFMATKTPETGSSHSDESSSRDADELYRGVDRPAGPDAEGTWRDPSENPEANDRGAG